MITKRTLPILLTLAMFSTVLMLSPLVTTSTIEAKKKKKKRKKKAAVPKVKKAKKEKKDVATGQTVAKPKKIVKNKKKKMAKKAEVTKITEKKTGKLIKRRVLVLNFVNAQKAVAYEYLSASIPESIATSLDDTGQFEILPHDIGEKAATDLHIDKHSINSEKNAAKIGRLCKADVVVTGQFLAIGSDLRIQAKAVDVASERVKVRKSKSGKTDASMFTSIANLGKELAGKMAKKLPPQEQRLIEKERTVYKDASDRPRERNIALSFHGMYMLPSKNVANAITGLFSAGLMANYQFIKGNFQIGADVASSYMLQREKAGYASTITFQVIGFWGGVDLGYALPFNKAISLRVHALGGYSISLLKHSIDNSNLTSGDPAVQAVFETRYLFNNHVFTSMTGAYQRIFYQDESIGEIMFGVAIGYIL